MSIELEKVSPDLAKAFGPGRFYVSWKSNFGYGAFAHCVGQPRLDANGRQIFSPDGVAAMVAHDLFVVRGSTPYCCGMSQMYGFGGSCREPEIWRMFFDLVSQNSAIPTILWLNQQTYPFYEAVREISTLIKQTRNKNHDSIIDTRMYVSKQHEEYVFDDKTPEHGRRL